MPHPIVQYDTLFKLFCQTQVAFSNQGHDLIHQKNSDILTQTRDTLKYYQTRIVVMFLPPLISEGSLEKCFQNLVLYFHQDNKNPT
jgi:hypothetical protein